MTDGSKERGALAPGAVIGIMGGGQLGRMTAIAAARLGYRCHIFTPERDSPASQVAAATTVARYDDKQALARFARAREACKRRVRCDREFGGVALLQPIELAGALRLQRLG